MYAYGRIGYDEVPSTKNMTGTPSKIAKAPVRGVPDPSVLSLI